MKKIWVPKYRITPSIAMNLLKIQEIKTKAESFSIPPSIISKMRNTMRINATHYSTRIEGNRLTIEEARDVIKSHKTYYGRKRDVKEVRNYWDALLEVEKKAAERTRFSEALIKKIHALVHYGKRAKPTEYRTVQNMIKDSVSGSIVYLPPEARDVPVLMKSYVSWVNENGGKLPVPIIASLVHYQFVTIHPYLDGNGRTARLLTTFILQRDGYGLDGLFSMEEYHAIDLNKYYEKLMTHPHHNYYEGRNTADLTGWVEYFVETLARVFINTEEELKKIKNKKNKNTAPIRLDHRQRIVLELFSTEESVKAKEMATELGLSERMTRNLMKKWVEDSFLEVENESNKNRSYKLSEKYRQYLSE